MKSMARRSSPGLSCAFLTGSITYRSVVCAFIFAQFFLAGCAKSDEGGKGVVVGYVNKEPIYKDDVKRELAMKMRLDPEFKMTSDAGNDAVNSIIDRKLMIQNAIKSGLAKDDRFVAIVKSFWEQALIKNLLDHKKAEFAATSESSDKDLADYYENLKWTVSFKIVRNNDKALVGSLYERAKKDLNDPLIPWQSFGPFSYDDLGSEALLDIFNEPVRTVKMAEESGVYYLIVVTNREGKKVGAFDQMKDELAKRVITMKERRFFEAWLKDERKKAKITVSPPKDWVK